jgi:small-conductance mechanosensitive channel
MGFRVTRVRTQNNEVVVVPNTTLATGEVTRPYGRDDFRVTVELGVDFDEDLDAVIEALREEAVAVGGVVEDPRPTVRAIAFDPNSVRLRAELWVREPDRVDVVRIRSTFIERVVERFDTMGVAISPASKHELSGELAVDDGSKADGGNAGLSE